MQSRQDAMRAATFKRWREEAIQQYKSGVVSRMLATGSNRELQRFEGAQRNGPCPCGSGRKFKRCCRTAVVK